MNPGRTPTTGRRAKGSAQVQVRLSAAEVAELDRLRGSESRAAFVTHALLVAFLRAPGPGN